MKLAIRFSDLYKALAVHYFEDGEWNVVHGTDSTSLSQVMQNLNNVKNNPESYGLK